MSSGFVNSNTPVEEVKRDDLWKEARRQIETVRRAKEDLAKQQSRKSLFEVLQANKEKKQSEFEEKARFKLHNALDDEEASYLDSVLEKSRREEARIQRETSEQLALFKSKQEDIGKQTLGTERVELPRNGQGQWATKGRKRKCGPEVSLLTGHKLQKTKSAPTEKKVKVEMSTMGQDSTAFSASLQPEYLATPLSKPSLDQPQAGSLLGLAYASSDNED